MTTRPTPFRMHALPAVAALAIGLGGPALGDTILGDAAKGSADATNGGATVSLTTKPVKHLDKPTAADMKILTDNYANWKFATGAAPDGTFNVLEYTAFANPGLGGAEFSVLFDDKVAKARTDYSWIQIVHAHLWGDKGTKDFNDTESKVFPFYTDYDPSPNDLPVILTPNPDDPTLYGPSIWKDVKNYPQRNIQNPKGGGKVPAGDLIFEDEPALSFDFLKPKDYASLDFALFLTTFTWNGKEGKDAGGTVTILDGMQWGVKVVPEPRSLLLLALGLFALRFARRGRGPARRPPVHSETIR